MTTTKVAMADLLQSFIAKTAPHLFTPNQT